MKALRLAWSSYQNRESLKKEKRDIEHLGIDYTRPESSGNMPDPADQFEIVIINSQFSITQSFLKLIPNVKLIVTASSGYDQIDLDACSNAGVTVARTPRARAQRVTEHTLALIHSFVRDIPTSHKKMLKGIWDRDGSFQRIRSLNNTTVGIVGYGVIGRKVTKRLNNIGVGQILVHDPHKQEVIQTDNHVTSCELLDLCEQADIVSLHADLNPTSFQMIDRESLELIGRDGVLINTARGDLVDFKNLFYALEQNELAGAALDVYYREPFKPRRFDELENVILTPHTAGFGPGMLDELRDEIVQTLDEFQSKGSVPEALNPRSF